MGAAAYLARLAAVVAEAGLSGMEHACGIPGSVGGAVAMNAGAYGWCMRDVVQEVQIATASGVRWVPAGETWSGAIASAGCPTARWSPPSVWACSRPSAAA